MATPVEFHYNDLLKFCNDFSNQNLLGEGGYANVFKGSIPNNNGYGLAAQLVAVKTAKFDVAPTKMEMQKLQFQNEKDWLSRVDHPNIIKLIGYCFNERAQCIVLEYAVGGKLTKHIEDLNWSNTLNIIKKVGGAIEYIHSLAGGYLHADIKCDNILLMEDNEPKLSDFGTMMQEGLYKELALTAGYLDPNVFLRGGVRQQSDDVYSFAVIILQMILKSSSLLKEDDEHISKWAFQVYKEKGSLVDGRLMNTGCSEQSAKVLYNVLYEVIKPSDETPDAVEAKWKKFYDFTRGLGKGTDEVLHDILPHMDESPTASSSTSRPSISEILIKLGEIKS